MDVDFILVIVRMKLFCSLPTWLSNELLCNIVVVVVGCIFMYEELLDELNDLNDDDDDDDDDDDNDDEGWHH